jgi:hypothetical protein
MHQAIYAELQRVAREQSQTTYSDIAPLAGLNMESPADRNAIADILREISTFEHDNNRPLLSVVVLHRDNNMPGDGFFKLARTLGVYSGKDDLTFFIRELRRVHDYWRQK